MARGAVTSNQASTSQQLASVIKSARDIMRKDKGLSGDLDRLPMLTWIMFLKFLDDMEQLRETEAALEGRPFGPAIEPPYRWRDWAANPGGITGDELIAFTNQDEAVRPGGTRGPGLFAYLRSLQGKDGGDRRDVIANVFRGTVNRMINGYLLRDVINKVNGVNFRSSDETHTLSLLYESMLKEMRDAAGDAGEFYTPRPVVRFIVAAVDPQLGETILDPAAGTGGFLVSAFEHLQKQCTKVDHHERLQRGSLFGVEAKPLPYLLCQMNLLLHGLEYPDLDYGNALRFPLREIGDKERVDIIMTNPPFGGEEEPGILGNFPEDKQTSETALLFLQLVMRKLRRPVGGYKGGRCGIVVPNGVLFGDGVCARIKDELLKEFRLHTIVRLPPGVFAPYTDIETNLVFFDRAGPTKEIWYYALPLSEGRKKYTKTKPLAFEEFRECLELWTARPNTEKSWTVPVQRVRENNFNLDIGNPSRQSGFQVDPPDNVVTAAVEPLPRIHEYLHTVRSQITTFLGKRGSARGRCYLPRSLGRIMQQVKRVVVIQPHEKYKLVGVRLHGLGPYERDTRIGAEIKASRMFIVRTDDVVLNRIWAREGSVGIVSADLDGAVVTADFPTFELNLAEIRPRYLAWLFKAPSFWAECERHSRGTSGQERVRIGDFLSIEVLLPRLDTQDAILDFVAVNANTVNQIQPLLLQIQEQTSMIVPSIVEEAFQGRL